MASHIERRKFLATLLGGAAVAWPLAARAQQPPKITRIGFLGATAPSDVFALDRFRAGLRDLGYVEGENILIDFRWAEGNYARLAEYATELIRLRVDILVTHGTPGTLAARQATKTVPIVMIVSGDAVATGLIASLARPGGNVTGSTFFDPELSAKRLELIKELSPSAKRVAVLLNPGNPVNAPIIEAMGRTAESLRLELQTFEARTPDEFQTVVSNMIRQRVDAVAVTQDTPFVSNSRKIAEIASNNRLAAIGFVYFAQVGGLLGYGPDIGDLWYRGAYFVDKILKGTKPADLPAEQPTRFILTINARTAKTLDVEIPATLLARADEVIE